MLLSKNCNSKEKQRMTLPSNVLQHRPINNPGGMALQSKLPLRLMTFIRVVAATMRGDETQTAPEILTEGLFQTDPLIRA
jgi:hypothetical protein